MISVFITKLPDHIQKEELLSLINESVDLIIPTDKSGNRKGYAFARFEDKDKASIAVDALNDSLINGVQLFAKITNPGNDPWS